MQKEIEFETITVDDLLTLSGDLTGSSSAWPIIAKAGVHGDFTDHESSVVSAAIDDACRKRGWTNRDPLLLQVAVALCRRISEGRIRDIASPKARSFLEHRIFARKTSADGLNTTPPFVSDILEMTQEILANKKLAAYLRDGISDWREERRFIFETKIPFQHYLRRKYGAYRPSADGEAWALAYEIAQRGYSGLDDPHLAATIDKNIEAGQWRHD